MLLHFTWGCSHRGAGQSARGRCHRGAEPRCGSPAAGAAKQPPPGPAPLASPAAPGPPRRSPRAPFLGPEGPVPRRRAAYLGAAVQRGLAEGAAAQGADGDVVQLLLLARQAAAAAGAAPARGLAAEVGADGVAVPLVLAQRHGGGAAPRRPGSPSARPRQPHGLHVGSRRRPGTASRRRGDLPLPPPPQPRPAPPARGSERSGAALSARWHREGRAGRRGLLHPTGPG